MEKCRCIDCNGIVKYYDRTKRLIKTRGGKRHFIFIQRFKCNDCGRIHRVLPDYILPYKHYESEIIFGVLDGLINSDTYGYEDYPCEMTMNRWRAEYH